MRALIAALQCPKGDVAGNLDRHIALLERARDEGCDVAVFPEMSLTGYHAAAAIALDSDPARRLVAATGRGQTGVAAVFGIVEDGDGGAGIAQVVASDGEIAAVQRKRHLGEDEDAFVAAPSGDAVVASIVGVTCGVAICAEAGLEPPFADAARLGARVVFVCAAPGLYGRRTDDASWLDGYAWWRGQCLADVQARARRYGLWIVVSTQAGATVDEDFPGWAALIDPAGAVAAELPDWQPGQLVVSINAE